MAPSLTNTSSPPASPMDECVDLECGLSAPHAASRRQRERDLVLAFDSRKLRRHEAWFLVETKWLDAWMSYVLAEENDDVNSASRPGPLTNDSLFDREEFRIRDGLQATRDYRGVNPYVYALYAELYRTDDAKPIVRWTLDLYAMPVMVDDIRDMLRGPQLKARALVTELNEELETQNKGLEGLRGTDEDRESWTYRCLCRCEFLVPCLHRLLGGGPTYKKETQSTWSDYLCCCKRNKKKKKGRSKKKRKEESDSDDSPTSSDEETQGLLD